MKKLNAFVMSGLLIAGFASQAMAQIETLPEVTVTAKTYKYLRAVDNKDAAPPVKLLQRKAAAYDLKNSEYYTESISLFYKTEVSGCA